MLEINHLDAGRVHGRLHKKCMCMQVFQIDIRVSSNDQGAIEKGLVFFKVARLDAITD